MVAIEATIVSTAMPQITADLGGLSLYSWAFASFLLAQTTMTVTFGKLSDVFGRKPIMLLGIAIFLLASLLAGFAQSMIALVAFRLLQGIGAGAIQPLAMTIVADEYSTLERGRIQGFLASVWAVAAVIGPLLGALLIHWLSWSWIFWINIPIGALAAAGFIRFLDKPGERRRVSLDIGGVVLFTLGIGALMVALTDGTALRERYAAVLWATFIVCVLLFVRHEARAPDPMVSLKLWASRPVAASNGASLLVGMGLMGLTTFLPMYIQGVLHQPPVSAGLALTMIMVGWPLGSVIMTRSFPRYGFRRMWVTGSLALPLGAAVFVFLEPGSSPVIAGVGSLITGLGMGFASISALMLIQNLVAPRERGAATASNMFSRNLGSTLGATVFGAVLSHGLTAAAVTDTHITEHLKQMLQNAGQTVAYDESVRLVLQHSLHGTFVAIFAVSVLAVLLVLLVPSSAMPSSGRGSSAGLKEALQEG